MDLPSMKVSTAVLLVSCGLFVPAALMWRMARLVQQDTQRFLKRNCKGFPAGEEMWLPA